MWKRFDRAAQGREAFGIRSEVKKSWERKRRRGKWIGRRCSPNFIKNQRKVRRKECE